MKRSLRNQLYIYLFFSTVVVVAANRTMATYLVSLETYRNVEQDMQRGLSTCAEKINDRQAFLTCYRDVNVQSISRQVSDFFVICRDANPDTPSDPSNPCLNIEATQVVWVDELENQTGTKRWTAPFITPGEWLGARLKPQARDPYILLNTKHIQTLLSQVWNLRDTKLIYVLPIIVFLWGFLIFLLMRVLMSSVVSLEKSLRALTPNTFDQAMAITSKYKEFDSITNIYRDLCARLAESFRRARSFTADASHEIKTPLTILRGNAERLIAELPQGMPAQRIARSMADEVERLIKISQQLILLSQADSDALIVDRQSFDLSGFIDALADDAVVFEKNITITKNIQAGLVWQCDPVLVKQLIHNLYTNAVKYNTPYGSISFKLLRLQSDFELHITNTSVGVSPEMATRVFERFYRGDAARNRHIDGLGLGLSICLEIAKAHQGGLRFEVGNPGLVTLALRAPLAT
jgi:signal transduction histidine kinase